MTFLQYGSFSTSELHIIYKVTFAANAMFPCYTHIQAISSVISKMHKSQLKQEQKHLNELGRMKANGGIKWPMDWNSH